MTNSGSIRYIVHGGWMMKMVVNLVALLILISAANSKAAETAALAALHVPCYHYDISFYLTSRT